jgi:hypothetical protein
MDGERQARRPSHHPGDRYDAVLCLCRADRPRHRLRPSVRRQLWRCGDRRTSHATADDCHIEAVPDMLVLSAWIRRTGTRYETRAATVYVTHSDEEKIERARMIGVLDDRDGPTWVADILMYESSDYALFRVHDAGVNRILSVNGGGC